MILRLDRMKLTKSNPFHLLIVVGHKTVKIAKRLYLTQMDHGAICNVDVFCWKI